METYIVEQFESTCSLATTRRVFGPYPSVAVAKSIVRKKWGRGYYPYHHHQQEFVRMWYTTSPPEEDGDLWDLVEWYPPCYGFGW